MRIIARAKRSPMKTWISRWYLSAGFNQQPHQRRAADYRERPQYYLPVEFTAKLGHRLQREVADGSATS